jgi:hypothetical protein
MYFLLLFSDPTPSKTCDNKTCAIEVYDPRDTWASIRFITQKPRTQCFRCEKTFCPECCRKRRDFSEDLCLSCEEVCLPEPEP